MNRDRGDISIGGIIFGMFTLFAAACAYDLYHRITGHIPIASGEFILAISIVATWVLIVGSVIVFGVVEGVKSLFGIETPPPDELAESLKMWQDFANDDMAPPHLRFNAPAMIRQIKAEIAERDANQSPKPVTSIRTRKTKRTLGVHEVS